MLTTKRTRWIAAGTLAVVLVAAGAVVASAGDREGRRHGGNRRAHAGRDGRARGEGRAKRADHAGRAMDRLDSLTDDQAKTALDASTALVRIRDDVRTRKAALLLQARRDAKASPEKRAEIREAFRAKVRALREEVRVPFTEAGMKVVRTLTPEQRAKIEEAAKKRGKTVTDESLARRFGMRLSRPRAAAMLRARVEGGARVDAGATPPAK